MRIIDNINKTVKDDLQVGIHKGSKMSVAAAACFFNLCVSETQKRLRALTSYVLSSPLTIRNPERGLRRQAGVLYSSHFRRKVWQLSLK